MRKPSEDGNWEFRLVETGWHRITFQDGIQPNIKKNDEGVESKTLLFPFKVDEDSPDNGALQKQFLGPWGNERAWAKVMDILSAVKLWDVFNEKFPDAPDWDAQVIANIQKRVPGKSCMLRFGVTKDGKFNEHFQINSFDWAKKQGIAVQGVGTTRPAVIEEAEKGEAKEEAKGKEGKAGAAAAKSSDWD
jgi:hypothetical protein